MATLSSHLLNSVDGTHANGVKVTIYQINSSGEKKIFFETETDKGGRILKDFELSNNDCACEYEMVCKTADYFSEKKIVSEIIVKFKMEDGTKRYDFEYKDKDGYINYYELYSCNNYCYCSSNGFLYTKDSMGSRCINGC